MLFSLSLLYSVEHRRVCLPLLGTDSANDEVWQSETRDVRDGGFLLLYGYSDDWGRKH